MENKFKFRTLTPIWTGDVDKKCLEIKESGIIGSLRWWFEAIVRGLGYFACDPTGEGKCPVRFKDKQSTIEFKNYCIACLIFGATGIRRLFKLEIDQNLKRCFYGTHIQIKQKNRKRGWFLGNGLVGEFSIKIIPLDSDFDKNLILLPLVLISKWGGLGAKTQHGYGVVELENGSNINISDFKNAIDKTKSSKRLKRLDKSIILRTGNINNLPNIKDMFFAKIQFEVKNDEWWKKVDGINDAQKIREWVKSGSVPIAPAIKNWLRFGGGKRLWLKDNKDKNERKRIENWLFGTTNRVCSYCYQDVRKHKSNPKNFWCPNCEKSLSKNETIERISSKINVSCAYKISDNIWEFRIWGWIPRENLPNSFDRDNFLDSLKDAIEHEGSAPMPYTELLGEDTQDHKLIAWREYNSPRDTIKQNESNIDKYIQSIIKG